MFIATQDSNDYWMFKTLFDMKTGLQYQFKFRYNGASTDGLPDVYLDIDSVQEGGGLRYGGEEAIDFWNALGAAIPAGEKHQQWISDSTDTAARLLDKRREAELPF